MYLKTAWSFIRRTPYQALAAIFVLAITFFITTILATLLYSSTIALEHFETRPQIIAFIKEDADELSIIELRMRLENDERLKEVRFVSKEDALEIYKDATSDNPLLAELVSPGIFPASLEFSVVELSLAQNVINDLRNEEIVDEVGFTASIQGEDTLNDVVEQLRRITYYIRIGGGVFVGSLIGASFLVLLVIISLRLSSRKEEIEILSLIGATKGFIRIPIIIESIVYTSAGVLVGWSVAIITILYSTPSIVKYFGQVPVIPSDTKELLVLYGTILAAELLVGMMLALTGSVIAISRVNKK